MPLDLFNCTIGECIFIPPIFNQNHLIEDDLFYIPDSFYLEVIKNITHIIHEIDIIRFYYIPCHTNYYNVISIEGGKYYFDNSDNKHIIYVSNITIKMHVKLLTFFLYIFLVIFLGIAYYTMICLYLKYIYNRRNINYNYGMTNYSRSNYGMSGYGITSYQISRFYNQRNINYEEYGSIDNHINEAEENNININYDIMVDLIQNKDGINDICCICLENFNNNDKFYLTKCKHYYHIECFEKLIKFKEICAMCRRDLKI